MIKSVSVSSSLGVRFVDVVGMIVVELMVDGLAVDGVSDNGLSVDESVISMADEVEMSNNNLEIKKF